MRVATLAMVATIGAATFAGPMQAATLPDASMVHSAYRTVAPAAGCPAGWRWDPSHSNRWSVRYPAHCTRN